MVWSTGGRRGEGARNEKRGTGGEERESTLQRLNCEHVWEDFSMAKYWENVCVEGQRGGLGKWGGFVQKGGLGKWCGSLCREEGKL